MAAAVPVISTNVGGLPEININGVTGFLSNVGDVEDMSNNITKILSDEKAFEKMKKNALAQAMKFDITNIVPQYEDLYKKVLEEK
jgi:L-malate glycosyltransferase